MHPALAAPPARAHDRPQLLRPHLFGPARAEPDQRGTFGRARSVTLELGPLGCHGNTLRTDWMLTLTLIAVRVPPASASYLPLLGLDVARMARRHADPMSVWREIDMRRLVNELGREPGLRVRDQKVTGPRLGPKRRIGDARHERPRRQEAARPWPTRRQGHYGRRECPARLAAPAPQVARRTITQETEPRASMTTSASTRKSTTPWTLGGRAGS